MIDRLKILLIEDNPGDARLFKELLYEAGAQYDMVWEQRLLAGLERLNPDGRDYAALLLDLSLPDSTGFETFSQVEARFPYMPIIVLTGYADEALSVRAMREGAQDYLVKGQINAYLLVKAIDYAIERKRAEEKVRRSNEEWEKTFAAVPDLIAILDVEHRVSRCNEAMAARMGLNPAECVGRKCFELFHGTDAPLKSCPFSRLMRDGREHTVEIEEDYLGASFQVSTFPLYDAGGRLEGCVHVARDITERQKAEAALRSSELKYRRLVETLQEGIWSIDEKGITSFVNPRMAEMLGYSVEEMLGKPVFAFMDQEGIRETEYYLERRKKGISEQHDFELIRKDGERIYVNMSVAPIIDDEHRYRGSTAGVADITERKAAEEEIRQLNVELEERVSLRTKELQRAMEQAEAANRAKSAFLSNMSHEIRTPMNAILGFSQLLRNDSSLKPDQIQKLENISRSGEHLLALINDILDISKIEAGRLTLSESNFDLHALLKDMVTMFTVRTDSKGLKIRVEMDPDLPRWVIADEGRLRQIIINLVGNAVKFTDEGEVIIRMRHQCENDGRWFLYGEIEDTGPGIPAHDLGHLFQPFHQTEAGLKAGGTGLGLVLSRQYARLMGGEVYVESALGKGSSFRFRVEIHRGKELPASFSTYRRRIRGIKSVSRQLCALVVDDNLDNRLLTKEILCTVGFEVVEAMNGREALEVFAQQSPDIVLMDLNMPILDGYKAISRLRMTPAGVKIPVIAITASAFDGERQRAMDSGADAYIRKPFRDYELLEAVGSLLGIEYLYDELVDEATRTVILSPAAMACIPSEVRDTILKTTINLDHDQLLSILEELSGDQPRIAAGLLELAKSYQYDTLISLLKTRE